jgi:hypothetical protein
MRQGATDRSPDHGRDRHKLIAFAIAMPLAMLIWLIADDWIRGPVAVGAPLWLCMLIYALMPGGAADMRGHARDWLPMFALPLVFGASWWLAGHADPTQLAALGAVVVSLWVVKMMRTHRVSLADPVDFGVGTLLWAGVVGPLCYQTAMRWLS